MDPPFDGDEVLIDTVFNSLGVRRYINKWTIT